MPAPLSALSRGRVCLALHPFAANFPLGARVAEAEGRLPSDLLTYPTIDDMEKVLRPQAVPEALISLKLRRVLLLQSGTSPHRAEVVVARVESMKDKHRRGRSYERMRAGNHPSLYLIGDKAWHGTNGVEAFVNLLSVTPLAKNAILRCTGQLDDAEMRAVSEKLVTSLELDISGLLARSG